MSSDLRICASLPGGAKPLRVPLMNELEIIRLNVERYRRMLQIEVDEDARRAIQKILEEFEAKLPSLRPRRD